MTKHEQAIVDLTKLLRIESKRANESGDAYEQGIVSGILMSRDTVILVDEEEL